MSLARIVNTIRSVLSTDLDQRDVVSDSKLTLDDATQKAAIAEHINIAPLGSKTFAVATYNLTRFGFVQVETDSPIRFLPAGDLFGIPVTPLLKPPLLASLGIPGPTILPEIQRGVLSVRTGLNDDNPVYSFTSFTISNPGPNAASIKVTFAGE